MTNSAILTPIVSISDAKPVTTSIDVASYFGKEHRNVLRDIQNLIRQVPELGRLNFEQSSYKNQQNKDQPCFIMDRKGFVLLAMGFTGSKALQFKIAYIDEFDRMERQLYGIRETLDDSEQAAIQLAVAHRAKKSSLHYQWIYRKLKEHFGVPRYNRIPSERFQEALDFINNLAFRDPLESDPRIITGGELHSLNIVVSALNSTYSELDDLCHHLRLLKSPYASTLGKVVHDITLSLYNVERILKRNQVPALEL